MVFIKSLLLKVRGLTARKLHLRRALLASPSLGRLQSQQSPYLAGKFGRGRFWRRAWFGRRAATGGAKKLSEFAAVSDSHPSE
jgi:hypothetical protein